MELSYHMLLALQAAAILFSAPAEAGTKCPDALKILPCSCRFSWPYTEVSCYATKTNHALLSAALGYMSLHGMVVDKMQFFGNLNYIPAGFFKSITIHYLVLKCNELADVSVDAFVKLSSVHSLLFYGTNLTSVPTRALSRCRLTELVIYNNNIKRIGDQLFGQMIYATVLRILYLTSDGIESIGRGAFYNLVSLEELSLKGNKLATIDSSVLPITTKFLQKLILQKNLLTEVPMDVIRAMPVSSEVDLSINQIVTADFHALLQFDIAIDMIANRLECNCSVLDIAIYNQQHSGSLKLRGNCVSPSSMRGKFLKDLRTKDFQNCLKILLFQPNLH